MRHQGRSAKGGRTTGGPRRVSAAEDPVSAPGHGCRSGRLRAGGWRASNGRLDVSVTCRAAAKLEFGHFTRQRRAGISAHSDSESGLGKALAQSEPALQDNRRQDARATLLWGRPSRNPNPPCKGGGSLRHLGPRRVQGHEAGTQDACPTASLRHLGPLRAQEPSEGGFPRVGQRPGFPCGSILLQGRVGITRRFSQGVALS